MRVLLDTNIIIHREASRVVNPGIGKLFNWLDKLGFIKCIHPLTIEEIQKHKDPKVVATMIIKIGNYQELKTQAPLKPEVVSISERMDKSVNDKIDSRILNELASERIDIIISEDKNIHTKAALLGLESYVFTIENFLEKVTGENPDLVSYKTLAVKKEYFGNIALTDTFFNSFRRDYFGFDKWFNRKSDETAYVCYEDNNLMAFLYLKKEDEKEDYSNIKPHFPKKKRLKVGTFKVTLNGYKLGERFLKIIFDNALLQKVDEIYVTIFENSTEQKRLIGLLQEWGFVKWGIKETGSEGEEIVLVRDFRPIFDLTNPKFTFPYISTGANAFIVPIYPEYHTNLLPDSILRTEAVGDFIDNEPYRNSISKVYVSRSQEKNLKSGDIIIFYRTGETHPKIYSSVVSTIGIVESVVTNIKSETDFISLCRKRSVFSDQELSKQWHYSPNRPFIVNFLYTYSFPKRINLKTLLELGVIANIGSVPRGFQKISLDKLESILKATNTHESIIIN